MRWFTVSPIRIVSLDDHALIREALKIRLSLEPDFKVLDAFSTSKELIDGLQRREIDVVVLDYQLTDDELDGLRLIQLLRSRHPNLKIVVFSSQERPATVNLSIRAGAIGFVGKSQETEDLLRAIRMAALNRVYLHPAISAEIENLPTRRTINSDNFTHEEMLAGNPELSPKESEVIRCCLEGLSVSQIATKFLRSRKTISGQKQAAFRKLGIRTDTELFKLHINSKV